MNRFILLFAFSVSCFLLSAQGFELFFGSSDNYHAIKVIEVPGEHACLVVSEKEVNEEPWINLAISKIDSIGNILFTKLFEDASSSYTFTGYDVMVEDDGFWICFHRFTSGNFQNIYKKKYNFNGELLSETITPVTGFISLTPIVFTSDKSVVVSLTMSQSDNSIVVKKIGNNGWTNQLAFEVPFYEVSDITVTAEDDVLLYLKEVFSTNPDLLVKISNEGELMWTTELPDYDQDVFITTFPDQDSYLVYGEPENGLNTRLTCVNTAGYVLWTQDFTAKLNSAEKDGVIAGENNTLYLTGIKNAAGSNIALLQIDESGNILLERNYIEFQTNNAGKLIRTSDGGFLISTETYPLVGPGYSSDPYVLKLNAQGELVWTWFGVRVGSYLSRDAIETSEGHFLILGNAGKGMFSNEYDNQLIKIDTLGNVYTHWIHGKLTFDENYSCKPEPDEQPLLNWMIKAEGWQSFYTYSGIEGTFRIGTNGSEVTLSAIPLNMAWGICPVDTTVSFDAVHDTVNVNLNAQAALACPVLEIDLSGPFIRRCMNSRYYISVKNSGTVASEETIVTVYLDPYIHFLSSEIMPVSVNNNTVVFALGELAVNEKINFDFKVEIECDAEPGQIHCTSASVTASNVCPVSILSNELSQTRDCQSNIGSFDPNDKRAFLNGYVTDRFIAADSLIEFQIRFQNTGTDTAFKVVITDTLSRLFDVTTLTTGACSHACEVEFEKSNILKFVFNNINLPDSTTNEPASHGFVNFSIRPVPGLKTGDIIQNNAAIYFDFNDPVITNTVELEVYGPTNSTVVNMGTSGVTIFPQPSSGNIHLLIPSFNPHANYRMEIWNVNGRLVRSTPLIHGKSMIENLPPGIHFFIIWVNDQLAETGRILIQ